MTEWHLRGWGPASCSALKAGCSEGFLRAAGPQSVMETWKRGFWLLSVNEPATAASGWINSEARAKVNWTKGKQPSFLCAPFDPGCHEKVLSTFGVDCPPSVKTSKMIIPVWVPIQVTLICGKLTLKLTNTLRDGLLPEDYISVCGGAGLRLMDPLSSCFSGKHYFTFILRYNFSEYNIIGWFFLSVFWISHITLLHPVSFLLSGLL